MSNIDKEYQKSNTKNMQLPSLITLPLGRNKKKESKKITKTNYVKEYEDCLDYIETYWDKIIRKPTRRRINKNFVVLPYHYITPNDKKFSYIYYWDTYFTFRGLMGTKREWVMKDMVKNFVYLFEKYGIIPNFAALASIGRSQPPFLTSMILDVYKTFNNGNKGRSRMRAIGDLILKPASTFGHMKWLDENMEIARREYSNAWNDSDGYNHFVEKYKLNRYGDRDVGYSYSSELESGWDFTSRFYNRCNEFLPIDLNSYLYKYEKDFELTESILDNKKKEHFWAKKATERKRLINKYMWDENEGFFYDFGYINKKQSNFLSLAGFAPMWAGISTQKQAARMIEKLKEFETPHGLTITSEKSLAPKTDLSHVPIRYRYAIRQIIKPKQWDYPSIWPPVEYLTIIGLLKYGFIEDAKRIMQKSLKVHAKIFRKYGTFFERIDGEKGERPNRNFQYNLQSGFSWTNAIFYRYIKILQSLEKEEDIYIFGETQKPPPYELSILH